MCHVNLLTPVERDMLNSLGAAHKAAFEGQIENLPRTRENVLGLLHRAIDLKDGRTTLTKFVEDVRARRADPNAEWNSEYERRQRKQAYISRLNPTLVGGVSIR